MPSNTLAEAKISAALGSNISTNRRTFFSTVEGIQCARTASDELHLLSEISS